MGNKHILTRMNRKVKQAGENSMIVVPKYMEPRRFTD